MTSQVIDKGSLPVQAGRRAGGPAGNQPLPAQAYLRDDVPVGAAEAARNDGLAPRRQNIVHEVILQVWQRFGC